MKFLTFFQLFTTNFSYDSDCTHLDQGHLRAESQEDFLCLGGVGVVSMLVEPLLEWPRHVLQGLTLVSNFATTGTTPVEKQVELMFR